MAGCMCMIVTFFFLVEFTYQTKDAATGAASIIVNDEGTYSHTDVSFPETDHFHIQIGILTLILWTSR